MTVTSTVMVILKSCGYQKRYFNCLEYLFSCTIFIYYYQQSPFMKNFERLNRLPPYVFSIVNELKMAARHRGEDIMLLANFFLRRCGTKFGKTARRFSPDSVKLLESYDWPGNVRELENRVQRAVIMSDETVIEPEYLDFSISSSKEGIHSFTNLTLKDAREMVEREMVIAAMEKQRNNMAKAADELGVSRPTLYDLVRKHNITKPLEQ